MRLTEKGREIRNVLAELFERHAESLEASSLLGSEGIEGVNTSLRRVERYWSDQIRYIY